MKGAIAFYTFISLAVQLGCGGETETDTVRVLDDAGSVAAGGTPSTDGGRSTPDASSNTVADDADVAVFQSGPAAACECSPGSYFVTVQGVDMSVTLTVPDPAVRIAECGVLYGTTEESCANYSVSFGACSGSGGAPPCIEAEESTLRYIDAAGRTWQGTATFSVEANSPEGSIIGSYEAAVESNGASLELNGTFTICGTVSRLLIIC